MVGICATAGCANPPSQYHVLQLSPDNAVTPGGMPYLLIYYLHLSTYPGTTPISIGDPSCTSPPQTTLPLSENTHVNAGCLIASSGNEAPVVNGKLPGPHLHLEIQRVLPHVTLPSNNNLNCKVNGVVMTCVPVDPYGSSCGTDPYFSLLKVPNIPLWNFPSYLSSNSLCFGTLTAGTSDQQILTLQNVAAKTLTISGVTVGGTSSADFTEANNCGTSLVPTQTCQLTVTFKPTAIGTRSATLTISGTDATGVRLVVSLVGSGG